MFAKRCGEMTLSLAHTEVMPEKHEDVLMSLLLALKYGLKGVDDIAILPFTPEQQ